MLLKDKKIELLKVTFTQDEIGQRVENLSPLCPPVWAYYRQLSQKEIFASMTINVDEEVLFVINRRTDISTENVIRFRGHLYNITRIDDFEGYIEDLKVFARGR
jgi:SPP1 family predicted phage head-tail adaptor